MPWLRACDVSSKRNVFMSVTLVKKKKEKKKSGGKQEAAGSIGVEIIWIHESFIKREITWTKLVLRVG